jgi:hypothetical protein
MPKSSRTTRKTIHPLYSHSVWSFFVFFIVTTIAVITLYLQGLRGYLNPSVGIFGALNLITPLIAYFLYKSFLSLKSAINSLTETNQQKWFSQQETFIFGINIWSVSTTFFFALVGSIMNYYAMGWFWASAIAKFFYFLHVIVLFGALGTLGWAYLGMLLFSHHLRNFKLDPEPFEAKKDEFQRINTSFLGVFFSGIILYIGAIIAVWLKLNPFAVYDHDILLFLLIVFPLVTIVICFFILIQHFLHEVMRKSKKIRLNKISLLIKKRYAKWKKSQLHSDAVPINDLLSWKEVIEREKDFPFNSLTVMLVLVIIFSPVIILFFSVIDAIIKLL